jgi:hypothetical protein
VSFEDESERELTAEEKLYLIPDNLNPKKDERKAEAVALAQGDDGEGGLLAYNTGIAEVRPSVRPFASSVRARSAAERARQAEGAGASARAEAEGDTPHTGRVLAPMLSVIRARRARRTVVRSAFPPPLLSRAIVDDSGRDRESPTTATATRPTDRSLSHSPHPPRAPRSLASPPASMRRAGSRRARSSVSLVGILAHSHDASSSGLAGVVPPRSRSR